MFQSGFILELVHQLHFILSSYRHWEELGLSLFLRIERRYSVRETSTGGMRIRILLLLVLRSRVKECWMKESHYFELVVVLIVVLVHPNGQKPLGEVP